MAGHETDDIRRRLKASLHSDTVEQLLTMVQHDALGLGGLESQLGQEARHYLQRVWSYAARWKAEGGPHRELRTRERLQGGSASMPLMGDVHVTYKTRVLSALPPWNDPSTLRMRGQLAGILEQEDARTDASASSTATQEGPLLRRRLDRVMARENDILSVLPPADQAPLKTLIELAQRLARAGSPNWDRRTIARSIQGLRAAGLIDAERLRRSKAGDRRAAE